MKTILNTDHHLHHAQAELDGGVFVPAYEMPSRVDTILNALQDRGFDTPARPDPLDMTSVRAIHDNGYLSFLTTAWDEWQATGRDGEVMANIIPTRSTQQDRVPTAIDGKVGFYALAVETSITSGTWAAARGSAATAQSAQRIVSQGARSAFALCRPPGHHATADQFGGYCFLNNAAIAAQCFRNDGAARVAILDVDFHHGNGTQAIFYDREDVFFASLHGHPEDEFPYFLGWADETGAGSGEGTNLNLPMRPGTKAEAWFDALETAKSAIAAFGAEALVISLGVDTFFEDPISSFKLQSEDFLTMGARIADLNLPTLFVMEGGYAVEAIGTNTVNVLQGFEDA